MLQHVSEFLSFIRWKDTLLHIYTTFCLFITEITLLNAFIFFIYVQMVIIYEKKEAEVTYFPLVLIFTY